MFMHKNEGKKSLIIKTWERCKSLGRGRKNSIGIPKPLVLKAKSKSWPRMKVSLDDESRPRKRRVAPEGCFSVYVGPQKQRFVIKTEYANHPLFKLLLEEAESEYGYNSEGPLELPCNVEMFCRVLMEMDGDDHGEIHQLCGFGAMGSYSLLSPSRLVPYIN